MLHTHTHTHSLPPTLSPSHTHKLKKKNCTHVPHDYHHVRDTEQALSRLEFAVDLSSVLWEFPKEDTVLCQGIGLSHTYSLAVYTSLCNTYISIANSIASGICSPPQFCVGKYSQGVKMWVYFPRGCMMYTRVYVDLYVYLCTFINVYWCDCVCFAWIYGVYLVPRAWEPDGCCFEKNIKDVFFHARIHWYTKVSLVY